VETEAERHKIEGIARASSAGTTYLATCSCGWGSPERKHHTEMWQDVADHKTDIEVVYQPYA
jgi:hypothetical protein